MFIQVEPTPRIGLTEMQPNINHNILGLLVNLEPFQAMHDRKQPVMRLAVWYHTTFDMWVEMPQSEAGACVSKSNINNNRVRRQQMLDLRKPNTDLQKKHVLAIRGWYN
jgi:hypothetical protein